MSILKKLGFNFGGSSEDSLLEDIYPFPLLLEAFVKNDVQALYKRILTDVLERTTGIKDDQKKLLWDNCMKSESNDGLVSLLSKAMAEKNELFLIYEKIADDGVIRKATADEQSQIKADYAKKAGSDVGIYVSFKNFTLNDMIKLYSAIEYATINGLYVTANVSRAVQLKVSDLRGSVANTDATIAINQAKNMVKALKQGKGLLMDAKDIIETAKPDLSATTTAIDFINQKRSFYLGLPASYLEGVASKGLGDSGKGDNKKVESGLRNYYFSIIKPVTEDLFEVKTTFKSDDFESITTANETLKTFELTSNELLSMENKNVIINKLYGLPEDEVGDPPEEPVLPEVDPNAPPAPVPGQKQPAQPVAVPAPKV